VWIVYSFIALYTLGHPPKIVVVGVVDVAKVPNHIARLEPRRLRHVGWLVPMGQLVRGCCSWFNVSLFLVSEKASFCDTRHEQPAFQTLEVPQTA
jgi:hypothetical protein